VRPLLLLLPLLSLLVAPAARAGCPSEGVQVYPSPGAVLPTNSRFFLEGHGASREPVAALVGRKLRLQADDDEVEVRVQRGWTSKLGLATVILRPSRPLKPDRRYTLRLDDLLPAVRLLNGRGSNMPEWRTGKGPDLKRPRWVKHPATSEGVSRRTPDGTERFVKLRMSLDEQSPAYLVVTLTRRRSDVSSQHYFVPIHDGVARLGHEACSGAFSLEEGKSYQARLEVVDAAGNLAPAIPPLQFEAPVAPQERP
jgi:hypothetical protein